MDIKFINGDYQFLFRTSIVIFNEDKTKILLFNVEGRSVYLIPGGKVAQKEDSLESIKRELKEELGFELSDISLLAVSEEFVTDKGYYNQQINLIYKGIYTEPIIERKFKGLEENWINFEWISIDELDKYNIYPKGIKNIVKNPDRIYHIAENLIK